MANKINSEGTIDLQSLAGSFNFLSVFTEVGILCLLLLVLPTTTKQATAQIDIVLDDNTRFENISVDQGLSSRYTTEIHQDAYGFIWIGTQNGLNLFDGMEFKVFRNEANNPGSLPDNYIHEIIETKDSSIWVCSEFGLSKYNRASESFTTFYVNTSDYYNPINSIREIYAMDDNLMLNAGERLYLFDIITHTFYNTGIETVPFPLEVWNDPVTMLPDSSGMLWILSKADQNLALYRFNDGKGTINKFLPAGDDPIKYSDLDVTTIFKVHPNILWLGTFGNGLYKLVVNEDGFYTHEHFDRFVSKTIITDYITSIFRDRNSSIWVGAKYGFYKLVDDGRSVPALNDEENIVFIKTNGVRDFSEDNSGSFWMTTLDGIFRFNQQDRNLTYFTNDPENPTSLSGNHPFEAFTDRSDQTWILTDNSGISRLNTHANSFLKIQKNTKKNSLSHDWITSFLVDSRGNFWTGTFGGGLNRTVYKKDHHFENFRQYFKPAAEKARPSYYGNFEVGVLYEDKKGDIWVGSYEGLNKYDPESDEFEHYHIRSIFDSRIEDHVITALFEDHLGTFWIGTQGGLNIFDRENGETYSLSYDPEDTSSTGIEYIHAIYEDKQNNLWFGGKYLNKLIRKDTSFLTYKPDPDNPKSINDATVRVIVGDKDQYLWLGTNTGLSKMNTLDETFVAVVDSNGLQQGPISGMCMDDHGNLWISKVTGGLSKYNPETRTFRNFNSADGLIDNKFVEGSYYKDQEGWMYYGGFKGFNVFHPDSIKENTVVPPVYITAFYLNDKRKFFDQPLYQKKEIHLNYDENEFTFDFVALNYLNAGKNKYAYKLEGYDDDWKNSEGQRFASYTNMSPGDYIFRVKASNNDGYWNEEGANLALVIHPPFWLTLWAYVLYAFLFAGILYLLRRYELNRLRLKQNLELNLIESEKRAELDLEKNKFFSNISHEFRTPLTLILGPLERLIGSPKDSYQEKELTLIRRNARRLQTLINQLLSLSKLESGKMKLKARPENIVKLIGLFIQSFHSMAEDKGIRLEFESDMDEHIVYVDPIKIEKIANNFLSNALKFTESGGTIKVSISLANHSMDGKQDNKQVQSSASGIEIRFFDTGIGVSKEKLERIFDRFYQVDEKQLKTNLGTGIGLALAKELIELHHGKVNVESELGMGTSFTIFLRKGKEHLKSDEIIESLTSESDEEDEILNDNYLYLKEGLSKEEITKELPVDESLPNLLIVEDNEDMRNYIKSYLLGSYNITEATNGKEGAEKAIEQIPDLIVSDLMMPIVDGNEMTTQLKTDERTSHIPIILLTAKASRESKLEGLETGADDFLTKPFDADELLIRIKNLVAQRRKLRELLSQHIGDANQTHLIQESSGKMMTKLDERFIEKATSVIQEQMSNPELTVEMLAREMAVSRMQLHRKLTSLTDNSASDLIRNLRLKRAAELLKEGELNVTQVSYEIGISSLSNFAKIFKDKYGVNPSEYS